LTIDAVNAVQGLMRQLLTRARPLLGPLRRFQPPAAASWFEWVPLIALFGCGVAVRLVALPHVTQDYTLFLDPWLQHFRAHGGFAGLKDDVANYNVPYLYLLAALTYLPGNPLAAVKLVSCLFDALLAYYVYRIVALRHPTPWVPRMAAAALFLLPTVFLNSSAWGQCDAVYAAPAVAGIYYLVVRQPWLGCFLLGVAFAVKLQTVFVFPLLLVLAVTRHLPWRTLLAVPAAYLGLAVPAALLGHNLRDLVMVYVDQAGESGALLSWNAPTVYPLLHVDSGAATLAQVGKIVAIALALLMVTLVLRAKRPLDPARILVIALLSVLTTVFFLPGMHERYFYLADVLSLVAVFWVPRLWPVPLLMQVASGAAYMPFLFAKPAPAGVLFDQPLLSLVTLAALVLTVREFSSQFDLPALFRPVPQTSAEPAFDPEPKLEAEPESIVDLDPESTPVLA
jgi:Gpi18-like mannosyltransferase